MYVAIGAMYCYQFVVCKIGSDLFVCRWTQTREPAFFVKPSRRCASAKRVSTSSESCTQHIYIKIKEESTSPFSTFFSSLMRSFLSCSRVLRWRVVFSASQKKRALAFASIDKRKDRYVTSTLSVIFDNKAREDDCLLVG